jgi:hypothetical protein
MNKVKLFRISENNGKIHSDMGNIVFWEVEYGHGFL